MTDSITFRCPDKTCSGTQAEWHDEFWSCERCGRVISLEKYAIVPAEKIGPKKRVCACDIRNIWRCGARGHEPECHDYKD